MLFLFDISHLPIKYFVQVVYILSSLLPPIFSILFPREKQLTQTKKFHIVCFCIFPVFTWQIIKNCFICKDTLILGISLDLETVSGRLTNGNLPLSHRLKIAICYINR